MGPGKSSWKKVYVPKESCYMGMAGLGAAVPIQGGLTILSMRGVEIMNKSESRSKWSFIFLALLALSFAVACAEVRLNTIPPPPPTAELRVFVQPLSGPPPSGGWGLPHPEWANRQYRIVQRFLQQRGIYRVVKKEEIQSVIGEQKFSNWDWQRKDWSLARQVGKALHADYAMIMERAAAHGYKFFDTVLINVETGKRFAVSLRLPKDPAFREEWQKINNVSYREIFRDAKGDMLNTIMRKSRLAQQRAAADVNPATVPPQPVRPKTPEASPLAPPSVAAAPYGPAVSEEPSTLTRMGREIDFEKALQAETTAEGRTRLAVYDLDASEPFKIVALILSEALREELFRVGQFTLVNRENIIQVMDEMGLQQSGLVDEKQAVQAGKGLAARQIIMGRLGVLGKTFVLQAKRIDVQSMGTVALGSLSCQLGKEEEMLARISELAQKLIGK
jgi:hypothetical protein